MPHKFFFTSPLRTLFYQKEENFKVKGSLIAVITCRKWKCSDNSKPESIIKLTPTTTTSIASFIK